MLHIHAALHKHRISARTNSTAPTDQYHDSVLGSSPLLPEGFAYLSALATAPRHHYHVSLSCISRLREECQSYARRRPSQARHLQTSLVARHRLEATSPTSRTIEYVSDIIDDGVYHSRSPGGSVALRCRVGASGRAVQVSRPTSAYIDPVLFQFPYLTLVTSIPLAKAALHIADPGHKWS